jgi:uncharacterized membrane protein YvbJ
MMTVNVVKPILVPCKRCGTRLLRGEKNCQNCGKVQK